MWKEIDESLNQNKKSNKPTFKRKNVLLPVALATTLTIANSCENNTANSSTDGIEVQVDLPQSNLKDDTQSKDLLEQEITTTINEWIMLTNEAKNATKMTYDELNETWRDTTPWMADLRKITLKTTNQALKNIDNKTNTIRINWYTYNLIDNKENLPDWNYYNKYNDTFYIISNNWNKILEYSDFMWTAKIYYKGENLTYWKDKAIDWFIGQFWDIISQQSKINSENGLTTHYNYKYNNNKWHYNFWIWNFEWVIENIYWDESSNWFQGIWTFKLRNWTTLIWRFSFKFNEFGANINWTWQIVYANKKTENWMWNQNLYNNIFKN